MKELYIPLGEKTLYLRHSEIKPNRSTLLFIHGLGDSGLAFEEVFKREEFNEFNLLVPDLTGYGRSSASKDYSFDSQVDTLWKMIGCLEKKSGAEINDLIVIGHSMGGIHAILMSNSPKKKIKKLILVEGSITQYGSFVSYKVREVLEQGKFEQWLENVFIENAIKKKLLNKYPSCGHYYASLLFCRRQAFLENALEIGKYRLALDGKWKNLAGEIYSKLDIPRVYCYGETSMCQETKDFLKEKLLDVEIFDTGCHFIMSDKKDEFYNFLYNYCKG